MWSIIRANQTIFLNLKWHYAREKELKQYEYFLKHTYPPVRAFQINSNNMKLIDKHLIKSHLKKVE